jgi:hypothetical protein
MDLTVVAIDSTTTDHDAATSYATTKDSATVAARTVVTTSVASRKHNRSWTRRDRHGFVSQLWNRSLRQRLDLLAALIDRRDFNLRRRTDGR